MPNLFCGTKFPEIIIFTPPKYFDDRGYFQEAYNREKYKSLKINDVFIQDNISYSQKGVLRGLHYTQRRPQAQLLTVLNGVIFDVVVDIRRDSPTFGKWSGSTLDSEGVNQIYMARGFAHGFFVLSDHACLHYKVTEFFDPLDDFGINYRDPNINIPWPTNNPIISEKDKSFPMLKEAF